LTFSSALSIASSINDSSGNSGSQSTSVIIEAVALGEIKLEDHRRVIFKEVAAGSHIGIVVALGSYVRTYFV
jgi:magnesium transporter